MFIEGNNIARENMSKKIKIVQNNVSKMRKDKTAENLTEVVLKIFKKEIAFTEVKEFFVYNDSNGIWENKNPRIFLKEIFKLSQSKRVLDEILYHIQNEPSIQVESSEFDKVSEKIVVKNGVLNIATLEIEDFYPELKATRAIDTKWSENGKNGEFSRFLNSMMEKEEQEYLKYHAGSGLLNNVPNQMLILYGNGANGKTTLMQAIGKVANMSNVPSSYFSTKESQKNFDSFQNRMVFVEEMPSNNLNATTIKMLTSTQGARISSERKFQDSREIEVRATTVVATNTLPTLSELTLGMRRRFAIIELEKSFIGKDQVFFNLYTEEAQEEILRWLVQGAHEFLNTIEKEQTEKMLITLKTWLNGQYENTVDNSIKEFIEERMEVTEDATDYVYFNPIIKEYNEWAAYTGAKKSKAKDVERALSTFGLEIVTKNPKVSDNLTGEAQSPRAKKVYYLKWNSISPAVLAG